MSKRNTDYSRSEDTFEEDPLKPLKASQGLTVGRVVHYVDETGQCLAATVSKVLDKDRGLAILHVLNPVMEDTAPKMFVTKAIFDEANTPGSWHWPEYVA